ncbi:hypothetical protein EMCRGX_G033111 [Ephydatia muelleri]
MQNRAITCLALTAFTLSFADASYRFEIEVQSYTNPISRNAYDMCCSPSDQDDCRNECNNAFLFCVREGGHQRDLQDCPLGTWWTSRIGGDAISFVPGQNIDNGVPNPLVVTGESWPGAAQVYIRVDNKRGVISDLVDTIFIDVALSPNSSLPVKSYTGDFDNANIELGFRITCSENYHGNNCTAYCTPGGAQYHCTAEGMTCNAGYKNPSTNCTECVPAHGCSTIGGYCTQPGECVCRPGFSGSLCGTSDTDPCSQQDSPCNEGTTCVNLGNSNYRCLCPSGYHGDHCQQSSDACSPNPCLNQGKCYVNGVANYTCVCPSRYKGQNCETGCIEPSPACTTCSDGVFCTAHTYGLGAGAQGTTTKTSTTSEILLGVFLCISVALVFTLSVVIVIVVFKRHKGSGNSGAVSTQRTSAIGSAENPLYDNVAPDSLVSTSEQSAGTCPAHESRANSNKALPTNTVYETVES